MPRKKVWFKVAAYSAMLVAFYPISVAFMSVGLFVANLLRMPEWGAATILALILVRSYFACVGMLIADMEKKPSPAP